MEKREDDGLGLIEDLMERIEVDDGELLERRHRFLKAAVEQYESPGAELMIGNYELPDEKICINGYFSNEDDQVFHVLSVIHGDGDPSFDYRGAFQDAVQHVSNFIFKSLSNDLKKMDSGNSVVEACMALHDAVTAGFALRVEYYTDAPRNTYTGILSEYRYNDLSAETKVVFLEDITEAIRGNAHEELTVRFVSGPLHVVRISSDHRHRHDVYVGSISGEELAHIYQKYNKTRLLEGNVRSYLNKTQKVNRGIIRTLREEPGKFAAYNNGLSIVASAEGSRIRHLRDLYYQITALRNMQIVNGGQTTVSIYECLGDRDVSLKDVTVPVKITILGKEGEEAELVSSISRCANTQTAINKSDLSSNDPFYRRMEQLSRRVPSYRNGLQSDDGRFYWYFERNSGQYNTERRLIYGNVGRFERLYPKKYRYSKKILAKAIMAFEQRPDLVCMGNEKNFEAFNRIVSENMIVPDEAYYRRFIGALILWREADAIIRKAGHPIKAAVLPYAIAMLSREYEARLPLEQIRSDMRVPASLRIAIESIACKINQYFEDHLEEHPNRLMWGRKKQCWKEMQGLARTVPSVDCSLDIVEFLPANPARSFIDDESNFNNVSLWDSLLVWNADRKILTLTQERLVRDHISRLSLTNLPVSSASRSKLADLFMTAVKENFDYRERGTCQLH